MDTAARMFNAANAVGLDEVFPEYQAAAKQIIGREFPSGAVVFLSFDDGSIVIGLGDKVEAGVMVEEFVGFSSILEVMKVNPDNPTVNARHVRRKELLREALDETRRIVAEQMAEMG